MTDDQRFGDFHYAPVVGTYTPKFSELLPHTSIAGLSLQSQYLYGGFRAESGTVYVLERKFIGPMTGGLYLLHNGGGRMELHEGSKRSAKGEMVRTIEPDFRRWITKGMLSGDHEEPIDLRIDDNAMTWEEGSLLSLSGPRPTLGGQFLSSMRDEPLAYASQPYWLTGTILGEQVEGPIFFDQVYFRHGSEWKEYPYYTDVQIVWNIFANKYADGTIEFGNITKGRRRWGAGIVAEGNQAIAEANHVGAEFEVDADGYVTGASYDLGEAGVWDFVGDPAQQLSGFNKARWGGYRAQGGMTRRRGDTREVVTGWTWVEAFSDRMKEEELLRH
ncbi:hypothetical protein GCM10009547_19180 [Sporichthya brevicatena]|uniref:Uncharacterized protein n=1 Tax=Sporichthya brevicatena TaxID=171442 RepID=A0ABN1GRA5_9ACTN